MQGNIDAEATARQNADTTLQSNIDAEELRAITREDAIDTGYKAADAIIVTDLTAALNTAVEALKDSRVTSFTGVTYTDAATLVLSDDIVGATPEDGVHLYKFTAADVMAQAIVETGVGPDINITYNDIIKVTVDGGVITAAVLADDALRAKFVSIDTSIAALETATTHSAIVGNFEMGTFIDITAGGRISFRSSQAANNDIESDLDGNAIVDIAGKLLTAGGSEKTVNTHFVDLYAAIESVESNLLQADSGTEVVGGFVKLGGELTRTTTFTGAQDVSFSDVNVVKVPYLVYDCFTATRNAQGYVTGQGAKTTGKVHVWFDENGDPINLYVPN